MRMHFALSLLAFSILGCSEPSEEREVPADGSVAVLGPGTTTRLELELGGVVRNYLVHVPASYTGETGVPLLFLVHGYSQSARTFIVGTDVVPLSEREGFVAVVPDGFERSWNASGCCGGNAQDDVAFFRAMITDLVSRLRIDERRIYSAGFSNGGMLSYRLACEASDVFAAIVAVAAGLTVSPDACAAARTRVVPLLEIHGDADPIVPAASGANGVAVYADLNGCATTSHPAEQPPSALDTTCVTHDGCGPEGEVTSCTVAGGGHCWFGNPTCGTGIRGAGALVGNNAEGIVASEAAWGFVSRFSCSTCGD